MAVCGWGRDDVRGCHRVAEEVDRSNGDMKEAMMFYHYVESGLDNVWLESGYTHHKTPYGDGVSIRNTDDLHRAIGEWLIALPKPLSGAELRFIRMEMELTQRNLAGILGADEQAVRRWEKSRKKDINGSADRLLRVLYKEYLRGDGSVRGMVDRLATLDQIDAPKGVFSKTPTGWRSELCSVDA